MSEKAALPISIKSLNSGLEEKSGPLVPMGTPAIESAIKIPPAAMNGIA